MGKVLFFAGSCRKNSFNKVLIQKAFELYQSHDGKGTLIDLGDYPMPLYNQDDEEAQKIPEAALKLHSLFLEHQGLFIAAPEYNSSLTPLLKNTLDWVSRPLNGIPAVKAFQHKVAALCSASPGAYGGMRGLIVLRQMLGNIGVLVHPTQVCIAKADQALQQQDYLKRLEKLTQEFAQLVSKTS